MNPDFIATLVASAIAIVAGIYIGIDMTKDEAVESNAACYYIDDNQNKAFKWGDCE